MPAISAILITYNEQSDLPEALESLRGVADEILVVDSGSTDRTCEVAQSLGARAVSPPFTNFGEQKNFAAGQAAHDRLLSLNADERQRGGPREAVAAWQHSDPAGAASQTKREPTYRSDSL